MFKYYDKELMKVPVKIWSENMESVDSNCIEQASHLAQLPFAFDHIALMPDCHKGKGMPIGGVIACKDIVIPNAVGVDIGCGMAFVQTDIPAELLRNTMTGSGELIRNIVGGILRAVPVGKAHFKKPQESAVLDKAKDELEKYSKDKELLPQIDDGYFQAGTLGGGNHFIEVQEDENGMTCLMLHSGSRHFGNIVGQHFNGIAHELNEKYFSSVPAEFNLPFLPVDSDEGERYLHWMSLSMDFAYENRGKMLEETKRVFNEQCEKFLGISANFSNEINCHHNYACLEEHQGEKLWVHRKGAIHAGDGEIAIIPGAMGSNSYIVSGLGNEESFTTSSHGAGRRYSRTAAMEEFSTEQVMVDLKKQGVILGKHSKKDVAEESRFAYKDIDKVMENQSDLTKPVKKLTTMGVVKG